MKFLNLSSKFTAILAALFCLATALQAQTNYTELEYKELVGLTVSGTLESDITCPLNSPIAGKDYTLNVEAGKTYKITVKYTSASAVDMDAGFYLLTGGELQGNYSDVIGEYWDDDHGTELSVIGSYEPYEDGSVRILLYDYYENNLDYTLTVEEIIGTTSYTDLNYAELTLGEPASGTLESNIVNPLGNIISGKGYSIDVKEGKAYKITVEYTSVSAVDMDAGFYLLSSELQGSNSDVIGQQSDRGYGTELTVADSYIADEDGTIRILLVDWNENNLDYTLSVEEIGTTSYTDLNYAKLTLGEPAPGTLQSNIVNPWGDIVSGKGYSIDVEAGKAYKITVEYTSASAVNTEVGFILLDDSYDYIGYQNVWDYGTEFTVADSYTAEEDGSVRILLYDYNGNNFGYTLTVEEVISYTKLEYAKLTLGEPAPGTLQSNIVNPWGDIVSGKGYSIDVEAGKAYKITVEYASVSAIDMDAGFFLLTGDELQGNYWDVINSYWGDGHGTKLSVTGSYAVTEDGLLRILLVDWNGNNLSYTLSVEEIETIHYTELVYAKIENGTTTGTLQSGIIYPDGNVFAGKDYSIDVEGGKTYKIAVKYTSESSVCMGAGFNLLTGGDLQGDLDDFIGGNGGYSCGTELTVISHYTANEAGSVRILLVDQNGNNLSYTLSVEEIETIHYTELVYAKIENGIATGTLESGIIAPWDEIVSGKGYSIDVEEGEAYKIAVKYTSESSVCMVAGFGLLTGDELQGDLDDLIGGDMDYSCGMELTVTDYYTADEDGAIRILLYDYSGNNLNYTITVEDETAQANQFRIDHAEALGKTTATVAIADKAIVNAAITAYGALNQAVRTLLATEKTLLDALLTKITELEAAEAIEQANQLAATKFRTDHAEALGKTTATIAIADKAIVNAAITAYNELAVAVQTLLATEKALLDELLAKIAELEAAEAIEQANQLAATQFRTDHATALSKTTATVAIADKAAVEAAITAYDALNQAVQTLLATEKALLDALLAEIAELTPIIANRGNRIIGAIGVQTGSNQIILQNVPQNAKVEVYNLKGKRVYSHPAFGTPPQRGISSHDNPQILVIEVQKGIYIVKINNQALRVGVK